MCKCSLHTNTYVCLFFNHIYSYVCVLLNLLICIYIPLCLYQTRGDFLDVDVDDDLS